MTAIIPHLASLSVKVALLGGIAWLQLYLLRRAPAASRSRLCSLALVAILLLAAGEFVRFTWMLEAPVYQFVAGAAVQPLTAPHARMPVDSVLAYIWMAGALFLLLRVAAGRIRIAVVRRASTASERIGEVELRMAAVQTPILTGWRRPTILVPQSASAWTKEQRRMVLTHELTHFYQGDMWTNLLAQLLRALLWFHPVVWLLIVRLSREQELTCDEAVVAFGHSRHDYAGFLIESARNLKSSEMFACSMAGSGARSLKERVAHLVDSRPRPPLRRRIALLLALLTVIATGLTVVRPVWSQSESGSKKVYKVGNGVSAPRLLAKTDPEYTQEAKDARIEGSVLLQCIVTAEGVADDIRIIRSLNPGLDQKAMEALAKWTFQPGTKDGQPVDVYATVEVHFRLK